MGVTLRSLYAIMICMSKIEAAIGVPIRQIVRPLQLAIGGTITLSSIGILLAQAVRLF